MSDLYFIFAGTVLVTGCTIPAGDWLLDSGFMSYRFRSCVFLTASALSLYLVILGLNATA